MRERALDMIRAQREALLDAGDEGLYSADSLEHALNRLDYQEIMLTSDPHWQRPQQDTATAALGAALPPDGRPNRRGRTEP